MTIPQYKPFDYFNTPLGEVKHNADKLKEYGLNESDVLKYENRIEVDRERWHKRQSDMSVWGTSLHWLVAVLILVVVIIAEDLICQVFGVEEEDYIANKVISVLGSVAIIGLEYLLWSKDVVVEWFNVWLEYQYKYKSQENVLIEKYMEDCHWEWYNKFLKPLYEMKEKIK